MSGLIAIVAVVVFAVCAACFDWCRFRIPNFLTIPFAGLGLAFHFLTSGWAGLTWSLLGILVGFLLLVAPFVFGGFGAGDVKLLSGAGAWLGPKDLMSVFAISAIVLGVVSLIKLFWTPSVRRRALTNLKIAFSQAAAFGKLLGGDDRVEDVVQQEDRNKRLVPFGVVFAIGLCVVLGWSTLFGDGFQIPDIFFNGSNR